MSLDYALNDQNAFTLLVLMMKLVSIKIYQIEKSFK